MTVDSLGILGQSIWDMTFLGNSPWQWLMLSGMLLGAMVLGKIVAVFVDSQADRLEAREGYVVTGKLLRCIENPLVILLLSVGELNANKNHQAGVRALSALNDPNVFYAICGSGAREGIGLASSSFIHGPAPPNGPTHKVAGTLGRRGGSSRIFPFAREIQSLNVAFQIRPQ